MHRCSELSTLIVFFGCLATLFSLVQCYEYNKDKYSMGLFVATGVGLSGRRGNCLGKCYKDTHNNRVCQVGPNDSDVGTYCKWLAKFSARYYTVYSSNKTQLCMSDCNYLNSITKKMCLTDTNWSECTTEIPRRITRISSGKDSHSSEVYVADNPTDAGTRCVTPCAATDQSMATFKCHDTKKALVNCYPSPDTTIMVKTFHKYASKRLSYINEKDQLLACPVKTHGRRRRDIDDDYTRQLEQIFNGVKTVEQMATHISQWFPVATLRWPDPNIYPDPSTEPIIEYAVRVLPGLVGDRQIVLPMMVRAIYSNYTLATLERASGYDEVNYARQDPRPGDEHGHLIQHALGGTEDPFNIVPQPLRLNRGGLWRRLEEIMRNYITRNRRGTIEHIVVVNYDFTVSYRPTSFGIRVRFYNELRQLVDQNGQRLNSFAENIYENCYVSNDINPCGT